MTRFLFPALLALLISVCAQAHHSFSLFEEEWTELEGELVELRWRNPHIYFFVETEEDNGEKRLWEMETGTIYMIGRAGVTQDMFNVGDTIRVAGHKSRAYPDMFHLKNVLLPNGREVITVANSPARWADAVTGGRNQWTNEALHKSEGPSGGNGIFRVWSPSAPGSVDAPVFDADTRSVESLLTDASRAARETWDAYAFDNNCELPGMPRVNFGPHPHQFIDEGESIRFTSDEFNVPRTIHLTSAEDPADQPASPLGYSVGRWENDRTLVVETSRINFPYLNLSGAGQSEQVRIVERYVLGDDESRLDYMITITDPVMLTAPYVQTGVWLDFNEAMGVYDCEVVNSD